MIELARNLINALNSSEIQYCHWKSNVRLDKGLAGDTDLDLLVKRQHAGLFSNLVTGLGFKVIRCEVWKDYPSITNYLGLDQETGKLIHLHVHYKLVMGQALVKDYHLPIEELFLEESQMMNGVHIPAPEMELFVHIFRMAVKQEKFWVRSMLRRILKRNYQEIQDIKELSWLVIRSDLTRFTEFINKVFNRTLVCDDFISTARMPEEVTNSGKLKNIRRSVKIFRRYGTLQSMFVKICRRSLKYLAKVNGGSGKQYISGGATVAVLGPDGSGKSTLCEGLRNRIGRKLWVNIFYLGSSQPTLINRIVRLSVVPLLVPRRIWPKIFWARRLRHYAHGMIELMNAWDRYYRSCKGVRLASRGCIVFFDRFPIPGVADQPIVWENEKEFSSDPLTVWIGGKIRHFYLQMRRPDFYIHLSLSPELALARKPEHALNQLEGKEHRLKDFTERMASTGKVTAIDASSNRENVLCHTLRAVWERL